MRKILNFVLIGVLVVACFGNFGCGKEIRYPNPEEASSKLNILYNHSVFNDYENNDLNFVAVELNIQEVEYHSDKDRYPGFVLYEVNSLASDDKRTDSEKIEKIKDVVVHMSEKVYKDETFKAGYRFFYQEKRDNFREGDKLYARVRFYDLNSLYTSYFQVTTIDEAASTIGESSLAKFIEAKKDGKRTDWTTANNREVWDKYKVLKLSNLTTNGSSNIKITLDSKPLSYYYGEENGVNKTALDFSDKGMTFAEGSNPAYIIFNDYYETFSLPTWVIVLGSVIILATAALVTFKILQTRKRKNEK